MITAWVKVYSITRIRAILTSSGTLPFFLIFPMKGRANKNEVAKIFMITQAISIVMVF